MVQLTQDCYAFGKKLVKLESALNKINKNINLKAFFILINTLPFILFLRFSLKFLIFLILRFLLNLDIKATKKFLWIFSQKLVNGCV